jgi:polyisoprenoid-binding protein YceI
MKRVRQMLLFFAIIFGSLSAFSAPSAVVDVTLSPAGSFKGKTNDVKGSAVLQNGEVTAKNIVVNLKSLKTSVELRDTHTQKHLQTSKYPEAVLVSAKGKNGKGIAKIRIRGIEKNVSGTYKVSGNELMADFKVNLPDFKITGIKYLGVGVQDEVTIHVTVPVTQGGTPARSSASVKSKSK